MADADTAFARGNAALARGLLAEAIAAFREASRLAPSHAGARGNLGVALVRAGLRQEAVACFEAAAVLQPFSAAAQRNLGRLLSELGRHADAASCFARGSVLAPEDAEMLLDLAHARLAEGRLDDAADTYRRALSQGGLVDAARASACTNLGNLLLTLEQVGEAEACHRAALAAAPDSAEIHANLGKTLLRQRRLVEAEHRFRAADALSPGSADAQAGLAVALLTQGRLPDGFAAFEHRWRMPQMRGSARAFAQPQWRGEPADGRTLLVHAEQGQGDTLQFCRYAVLAARRGFCVVLEVQSSLVRLLQRLPGVALVVARGEALPGFDLHCPMLSLPLAFGTTLETIPPVSLLRETRKRRRSGRLQVGLCWAGNAYRDQPELALVDQRRSIPPAMLSPLLSIPGVRFQSLQKGDSAVWSDPRLEDRMGEMRDFADTAALVERLDLVIAADSAVAHLAATLGCEVWLLDRFDSCWRWLEGREDSPWYPGLRIYRQTRPGGWAEVVDRVYRDLGGVGLRRAGS